MSVDGVSKSDRELQAECSGLDNPEDEWFSMS
jgi:hypothetical protein